MRERERERENKKRKKKEEKGKKKKEKEEKNDEKGGRTNYRKINQLASVEVSAVSASG